MGNLKLNFCLWPRWNNRDWIYPYEIVKGDKICEIVFKYWTLGSARL